MPGVTEAVPDPADGLLQFLAASPSPYHAVQRAVDELAASGFVAVDPTRPWPSPQSTVADARFYLRNGGALLAWVVPAGAGADSPFRIVAAHTDSPGLRVKPRPDIGSAGWKQVGVQVYGGPLLNSWLDRDLGVAGRLVTRDARQHLVNLDLPVCRVSQLAVHLDRAVNESGLTLDRQRHLSPIWGMGTARPGEFMAVLADAAGVEPRSVVAADLALYDLTPPALLGLTGEFVVSARLDNQFSCWAAVRALVESAGGPEQGGDGSGVGSERCTVTVAALFDHEEVGSNSATGAAGPLLPDLLERVVLAAGGGRDELHRAVAGSTLVSADMAHAVHPNYPERSEPAHAPLPNGGPVIKVNADQRYATDAGTAGAFAETCRGADVPHQLFLSNNSMPCGSTIGPALATRLGIATVDVGRAQLSMHSARELAGAADAGHLLAALSGFYSGG